MDNLPLFEAGNERLTATKHSLCLKDYEYFVYRTFSCFLKQGES